MKFQTIEVAHHGPVAVITLNRPDKLNAINKTMLDELNVALQLGIVNEVTESGEALVRSLALAREIAMMDADSVRLTKGTGI